MKMRFKALLMPFLINIDIVLLRASSSNIVAYALATQVGCYTRNEIWLETHPPWIHEVMRREAFIVFVFSLVLNFCTKNNLVQD